MEFVDNTGHIFSLPSYNEKPIGYEYDEYSYVFWIDSNNTSKLSVNNFYSRPIYALYELNKDFNIEDLEDDFDSPIQIEIYANESKVFKLISSKEFQKSISHENFKLTDYVDLNMFEPIKNGNNVEYKENFNFIKDKLTNEDLYCVKTEETIYANDNDINGTTINYLMIPIYPIAMSTEAGTWITNIMIHIYNSSTDINEWCYISVGGEFINEYEELIINGRNMGISLPKDILKAVYAESLYNNEYNEALFNEKMKEYMLNYMNIHGEIGNFKSAIDSLKWFGYGDKISVSKLLRTDNEVKEQYILDYFNISYDILESFKLFKSTSLLSLMIMLNKESDEQYPFDNAEIKTLYNGFLGENKPKMLSLMDNYEKIKIGNHDMPIEDDEEKYWYWKPYFDFSFNELGIKLLCLSYYYKKYFLPIHLNIHNASLGYRVFINDIKLTNTVGYSLSYPSIVLNNKNDIKFTGNGIHYFTKQIHFIDDNYNEFQMSESLFNKYQTHNDLDLYNINDTCVNIPIKFINNEFNNGYYNCVLLLKKESNNETIYESHFSFLQSDENIYKNFIIYPKKFNTKIISDNGNVKRETRYIEYWVDNKFVIYLLVNNKWYEYHFVLKIHNPTIDFGTLQYRYYYNDHNYLLGKILNNKNGNIHNIIMCGYDDIEKIHNIGEDTIGIYKYNYYFNFEAPDRDSNNNPNNFGITNIPDNYVVRRIDNSLLIDDNISDNEFEKINEDREFYLSSWSNNQSSTDIFYVIYRYQNGTTYIDFENDANIFHKFDYVTFKNSLDNEQTQYSLIIYPEEWGETILFTNELKKINSIIYNELELNGESSYIESFNLENEEYVYQFFKQNYNLLSPFKQIHYIDDNNKTVSFNAYMHNKQLVDMNEINFDVNIYDILQYHLDYNLLYIDGTLLDNEFYQYITYTDFTGKEYEIYIHKDLIGHQISFLLQDLNKATGNKILLYAYSGTLFMLNEYPNVDSSSYVILSVNDIKQNNVNIVNDNSNWLLFEAEDEYSYIAFDTVELDFDDINYCYYENKNNEHINYKIYDKLYNNIGCINNKYLSTVNLPNNMKYKNSFHLFDLCTAEVIEYNILLFHDNIDMWINGLNFIHNKTLGNPNETDNELKIYIYNKLSSNIDSRYPDIYGLYWTSPFIDEYQPVLPKEISLFEDNFGLFVKREYRKIFDSNEETKPTMWELDNLYQYDTQEFTYYKETTNTCIGYVYYESLEDFYKNKWLSKDLFDEYNDIEIFLKETDNGDYKFCFYDKELKVINNLKEYYINELFYEIQFIDENDNIIDISINKISNEQYDKVKIKFYYNKSHIVRNRFYMVMDYINMLIDSGKSVERFNFNKENDKYYLNISINNNQYKIELVEYKQKYRYVDGMYNNIISNQNPSMYWYDLDNNQLNSLPYYLNELERYVYNENDSIETFIQNMNNYIAQYYNNKQYANDNNEARYMYSNYLVKDLTGISGNIRIELTTSFDNSDNKLRICIEIIDENNNISVYNKIGDVFNLTGKEKQVKAYIQFVKTDNVIYNFNNEWFIPKLIKVTDIESKLEYHPEECGVDTISINYLNKEFKYGDNKNEYVYKLYKDFFNLKFNVYDACLTNNQINMKLLHSVYDCIDDIKLDTYLNYDFYLMHDDKYWYGLYISQETCDKIRNKKDLNIGDNLKKSFTNNDGIKYVLNYSRSSEEYLINRLEFNSSMGLNQFNDDDIVCCYLHNNDRLPFNVDISSKWKISPMSLGMSTDTTFDSNGEMTIISLPKNNNKYEHGYYKVSVKYSLDRDIQHQFKNTSTIRIS